MNMHLRKDEAKIALLRRIPALRGCSDQELAEVARFVDEVDLPEGTFLTEEGSLGQEAFVIVDGWAAVTVNDEPVAALRPGEFVGEMAMLDHGRRTATVVAKTPIRALAIGPRAFPTFIAQPAVAKGITKSLAERLRHADAQIGVTSSGDDHHT